jgi:hypothetical protein
MFIGELAGTRNPNATSMDHQSWPYHCQLYQVSILHLPSLISFTILLLFHFTCHLKKSTSLKFRARSTPKMADEKHEKNNSHNSPVVESDNDIHSVIQVGDIIHIHATPEEEARVLRKIDWLSVFPPHGPELSPLTYGSIPPLMGFCYMLQYTDKVSLGYSTQLGLIEDLVHSPQPPKIPTQTDENRNS